MFQHPRNAQLSTFRYDMTRARATKLASALAILGALALGGCEALPRVDVRAPEGTTTSEAGGSVKLIVSLASRPATPVEIRAVSSDDSEGEVSAAITFDAQNYREPQALYVTGVDDSERDGDVRYRVSIYARTEPGSPGWLVKRLTLTNRDDDVPMFEALGHLQDATTSFAADVSADGSVVVGTSRGQAFRWTSAGMVGLDGIDGRAEAVSPDGTKIVGSIADARFEKGRAAASFAVGQPVQLLAEPPQPGPGTGLLLWFVDGTVVLDDGTVFGTCIQYGAYGEPLGCKKGATLDLAGGSFIYAATASHRAGTQNAERHAPFSARAFFDGQLLAYPSPSACPPYVGCEAAVRAFSADASVLVGTAKLPLAGATLTEVAIRYTASEGMTTLPDLEGGEQASGAYAISADGRTIAGFATDERGPQATLWIDGVPQAVEDLVLDADGALPDGWSLREVRALSADGKVLVGNGLNPEGYADGFRVTLR